MQGRFRLRNGFWADRRGITALEYGIMAALIAAVVGLGVSQVGQALLDMWQVVTTALPQDGPSAPSATPAR